MPSNTTNTAMTAIFRKPARITGRAKPDLGDAAAQARSEKAEAIVAEMWVDTDRQRAILLAIRQYMRLCKKLRKRRGTAIPGRRLSQFSQAGKSAIVERLIAELEQEAIAAGEEHNPFRVIHITIDTRMSLKMLYQEILNRLADDFLDQPGAVGLRVTAEMAEKIKGKSTDNVKIVEQRVEEWTAKLGVELVVVDEVQRLVTKPERVLADGDLDDGTFFTADATDVTKKLQGFLDRGVVPLFFIGDETSEVFFKLNQQFAARLGDPLELKPLNMGRVADRRQFHKFCIEYDKELRRRGAIAAPTCLPEPDVLTALITASGGHIGRAARIIEVALPKALARAAVTMEAYDLSNAVRSFAIGLDWVDHDPFSIQYVPVQQPAAEEAEVDAA